jgi:hypothetical protein
VGFCATEATRFSSDLKCLFSLYKLCLRFSSAVSSSNICSLVIQLILSHSKNNLKFCSAITKEFANDKNGNPYILLSILKSLPSFYFLDKRVFNGFFEMSKLSVKTEKRVGFACFREFIRHYSLESHSRMKCEDNYSLAVEYFSKENLLLDLNASIPLVVRAFHDILKNCDTILYLQYVSSIFLASNFLFQKEVKLLTKQITSKVDNFNEFTTLLASMDPFVLHLFVSFSEFYELLEKYGDSESFKYIFNSISKISSINQQIICSSYFDLLKLWFRKKHNKKDLADCINILIEEVNIPDREKLLDFLGSIRTTFYNFREVMPSIYLKSMCLVTNLEQNSLSLSFFNSAYVFSLLTAQMMRISDIHYVKCCSEISMSALSKGCFGMAFDVMKECLQSVSMLEESDVLDIKSQQEMFRVLRNVVAVVVLMPSSSSPTFWIKALLKAIDNGCCAKYHTLKSALYLELIVFPKKIPNLISNQHFFDMTELSSLITKSILNMIQEIKLSVTNTADQVDISIRQTEVIMFHTCVDSNSYDIVINNIEYLKRSLKNLKEEETVFGVTERSLWLHNIIEKLESKLVSITPTSLEEKIDFRDEKDSKYWAHIENYLLNKKQAPFLKSILNEISCL